MVGSEACMLLENCGRKVVLGKTYPSYGSKHSNTSVSDLSLAVTLGLRDSEGGGIGEFEGIEEAHGSRDTGEGKHVFLASEVSGSGGLQNQEAKRVSWCVSVGSRDKIALCG